MIKNHVYRTRLRIAFFLKRQEAQFSTVGIIKILVARRLLRREFTRLAVMKFTRICSVGKNLYLYPFLYFSLSSLKFSA
jgi:hypothetical protein